MLIEQNVAESLALAEFATVLENGEVALSGAAAEVADDDRVRKAYLGLLTTDDPTKPVRS